MIKINVEWGPVYFTSEITVCFCVKSEARTETEAMQEHWLLTYSPELNQPAFLYISGPPAQCWHHHSELVLPTSFTDQ